MVNNVVLIVVDALRRDTVSYVNPSLDPKTTPFIDRLAGAGRFYKQAVATGSGTSTSFPGILAGRLPMDHGYDGLQSEDVSLAEHLSEHAVRTIGITGNIATSSAFDYDRGFDHFHDVSGGSEDSAPTSAIKHFVKQIPKGETIGQRALDWKDKMQTRLSSGPPDVPYIRAEEVTDCALEYLRRERERRPNSPRFMYLHYMDTHNPYAPPDTFVEEFCPPGTDLADVNSWVARWNRERPELHHNQDHPVFSKPEMDIIQSVYNAEARYVDSQIKRFVNKLNAMDELEETLIILCADHGEEFMDHGDYAHRPKLYEELIHVPLILYDGSDSIVQEVKDVKSPVSLKMIPTTVSTLLDIQRAKKWNPDSLINIQEEQSEDIDPSKVTITELCHTSGLGGSVDPSLAKIAIRTPSRKYITNAQTGTDKIFNLEEDSAEEEPHCNKPAEARVLIERAQERQAKINQKNKRSRKNSAQVRSQLEDLGYLE